MKNLCFTILCLLFLTLWSSAIVRACSCFAPPPLYESFKQSAAVFTGTVTKLEKVKVKDDKGESETTENIFHFQVAEAFKGVDGKTFKINAGANDNSCYSSFTIGDSFLIFAQKDNDSYYCGMCSRKESLERAQDEIFFIRELLAGKPESQIYGMVTRNDNFPGTDKPRVTRLSGVKVLVEGGKKILEKLTDKNGVFRFNNIPEGKYTVKAVVSDEDEARGTEIISVLPDKKISIDQGMGFDNSYNSFFADLSTGWNNHASGNIYDHLGNAVKHACVELLPVSLANSSKDLIDKKFYGNQCDNDFFVGSVTPGQYILAIETFAPFGERNKIRTFYPQALTADKAQILDIEANTELEFDIKLPIEQTVRDIKGEVVWSNGMPFDKDATALLTKVEKVADRQDWINSNEWFYDIEDTDEGKFVLQGFENAEYWLHVFATVDVMINGEEKEIEVKANPFKIKLDKNIEPVKIVLQMPEGIIE